METNPTGQPYVELLEKIGGVEWEECQYEGHTPSIYRLIYIPRPADWHESDSRAWQPYRIRESPQAMPGEWLHYSCILPSMARARIEKASREWLRENDKEHHWTTGTTQYMGGRYNLWRRRHDHIDPDSWGVFPTETEALLAAVTKVLKEM